MAKTTTPNGRPVAPAAPPASPLDAPEQSPLPEAPTVPAQSSAPPPTEAPPPVPAQFSAPPPPPPEAPLVPARRADAPLYIDSASRPAPTLEALNARHHEVAGISEQTKDMAIEAAKAAVEAAMRHAGARSLRG